MIEVQKRISEEWKKAPAEKKREFEEKSAREQREFEQALTELVRGRQSARPGSTAGTLLSLAAGPLPPSPRA